jgi:hypothetical protein
MATPCPTCGYDLSSHLTSTSATVRCPECGTSTARERFEAKRMDARSAWALWLTLLISSGMCFFVAAIAVTSNDLGFRFDTWRRLSGVLALLWPAWMLTVAWSCSRLVNGPGRSWHVYALWMLSIIVGLGGCCGIVWNSLMQFAQVT